MYKRKGAGTPPLAFAPSELKRMATEYEGGFTLREIAQLRGVTSHRVRKALVAQGVRIRSRTDTAFNARQREAALEIDRKMAAEYRGGDSLRVIADRHGVSRQRVHSRLKRIGVAMRRR